MATSAPSSASARALATPMPREPPVTRATLPESFLVMGFLRCLNSDGLWICLARWYRNRNYRNSLFPDYLLEGLENGKTPGFRGARDFRQGRGVAVVRRRLERTRTVKSHGIEGGQPARATARRAAVQPHLAAAGADRRRTKAGRTCHTVVGRRRSGRE